MQRGRHRDHGRGAAVAIPFHVYLSDGAVGAGHPYGNLLAAADMVGLPVVVTLFADRNADGFIGPTGKDPARRPCARRARADRHRGRASTATVAPRV
jgi:hypothetical protein